MRIAEISTVTSPQTTAKTKKVENRSFANFVSLKPDSFSFTGVRPEDTIKFKQTAKTMHVVSFTGLNDPTPVAIQFKVRDVTRYQEDFDVTQAKLQRPEAAKPGTEQRETRATKMIGNKMVVMKNSSGHAKVVKELDPSKNSINRLADSNWLDGKELLLINDTKTKQAEIVDPEFGQIGCIPEEINLQLQAIGAEYTDPKKRAENFRIELSNVIAGTTKGAPTTGLRANFIYTGTNKETKEKVEKVFDDILNDKESMDLVFLYQEETNPDEILGRIFENDAINNNVQASKEAKTAIANILDVIDDPKNKNILLLGHCKPDGDTLGCVLGLKNAIDYKYSDTGKTVDCAVDDKIPGLFRHKLPGIDGVIKRPYDENQIAKITREIKELQSSNVKTAKEQIKILQDEKESLQNPANLTDPNKKYDVVVLMDVPTPKRFTDKFKEQIEGAKKVIYIDHHPHRLNEWQQAKDETGIDMEKIHSNHLAWISDAVPAATEQIAILAKKMIPELGTKKYNDLSQDKKDNLDAFVASTVVGMSTDTGAFNRTANLLPEHMKIPVQQRPNFMPEGLSKWLMGLSDKVNKKWIRDEITFDIADTKKSELDKTAREMMIDYARDGVLTDPSLSLGIVAVDYDAMNTVWRTALETEPETTFLDVQNAFKYSEVMGTFRSDPAKRPEEEDDYKGDYDNDRVAVLICQDKKEGELDEKYNIATQNGLRLSLRSVDGSEHAELLACLFGGGGHGGASGGRVDLPGVGLDSKLAVKINGEIESDYKAIYETLRHNVDVSSDSHLSPAQKKAQSSKIELTIDESGQNCSELIRLVTAEIREAGPAATVAKPKKDSGIYGYTKGVHEARHARFTEEYVRNQYGSCSTREDRENILKIMNEMNAKVDAHNKKLDEDERAYNKKQKG